jgi:hypothetical protein
MRRFLHCRLLVGVLALFAAVGPCLAAGEVTLAGRVVDRGGEGIHGATVYLRHVDRGPNTSYEDSHIIEEERSIGLWVIRTDADGSFAASLPTGRYDLAAFKAGYDFSLTAVNTRARGVVDLSLEKTGDIQLGDLPVGSAGQNLGLDWILRRSTKDVLRDRNRVAIANRPLASEDRWRPESRMGSMTRSLDGTFTHRFSGGDPLGGNSASLGNTSGRSTALALRGGIGENGAWRFLGREGKSYTEMGNVSAVHHDQHSDRIIAGLDYRVSAADDLSATLEYGTSRYIVDSQDLSGSLTDQEQRSLGFQSRWDRALGDTARLYVDGTFHETGVTLPGASSAALPSSPAAEQMSRATDRSWLASAGVALDAGDHRLGFGIRTKSYQYGLRDQGVLLYGMPNSPSLVERGARGNAMSLFAVDDWRLADHLVLNYGVGYHSSLTEGGAYFLPTVGMTHDLAADGRTILRSMLMFRVDDPGRPWSEAAAEGGGHTEMTTPGRLGYLIGLERRPEDSLQIAATLRYEPFQQQGPDPARGGFEPTGIWSQGELFLTDGAAAHHELDVNLARVFGPFRGMVSGSVGRVSGRLTPTVERAPIQVLSMGEMHYYLTRFSAAYEPSDTEVQIGYHWVTADTHDDPVGSAGGVDYRLLDLVIYQELPWLRKVGNARWKVLMAYRGADYGSLLDGTGERTGGSSSRFTGGVDIQF